MLKILVVDDDPRVHRSLSALFEGHEVVTCDTVKDAKYTIVMNSIAPFDVIVSDERIPGEKGHTLINWCIQSAIDSKLVMLTAVPIDKEFRDKIREPEKVFFVSKPWDPQKLLDIVVGEDD
ncbi:MAG: response regulator [Arenicella sp.]